MSTTPKYGFPLPLDTSLIRDFPKVVREQSLSLEDLLPRAMAEEARRHAYINKYVQAVNLLPRASFAAFPTGWQYLGGTGTVTGTAATVTGNGTVEGIGLYTAAGHRFPGQGGHRYFVSVELEALTAGAHAMGASLSDGSSHIYLGGSDAAVQNPVVGQRYRFHDVITLPDSWHGKQIQFYQRAYFKSSNGAKVRIYPATVLDLTADYGAGMEPDLATAAHLVRGQGGGYVEGIAERFELTDTALRRFTSGLPTPTSGTAGPPVVLRFDDGYLTNQTNAVPVMEPWGFKGVLYTATHPASWLGQSHGGHPLMNADQLLKQHTQHGWEIGSHTRDHADANNGDPAVWIENARQACQDLVNIGLPWPSTFAYPNGSRNVVTDRAIYRLHDTCGLTGHPSTTPVREGSPTFFTGWATINGVTGTAADIERAKAYVLESTRRGEVPILGFHGITDNTPDAGYHLARADFKTIIDWLGERGYRTVTMAELSPHNLLKDPGFETRPLGYPWVGGPGWTRTRSTAPGHTGFMGANLGEGVAGELYQNAAVTPGTEYRVRVRFGVRTITAGSLSVTATPQGPTGAAISSPVVIGSVSAGTAETDVTGLVTVPPHASSLKVSVTPAGFTGSARVVHAALYESALYDPLS